MSEGSGPPRLRPVGGEVAGTAPEMHPPGDGLTQPLQRGRRARFISDVIVDLGFLPRERVSGAVEEGRASGRTPEQVLLESGALTSDQLARAIAERFGLPHADLNVYKADLSALNLISPRRPGGSTPRRSDSTAKERSSWPWAIRRTCSRWTT